jgi:carbamoyl-phosphate synthase large subunit
MQAIIDEADNVHLIECNPRVGGASMLSIYAGLDSFLLVLL